jgi:hypothetical protein
MTSRDSARPQYSAVWHQENPSAADCLKTGLTSRTTATIAVKGFCIPAELFNQMRSMGGENKTPIGEIKKGDVFWQGTVRTDTNIYYDLSGMSKVADKITIDGVDYVFEASANETLKNEMLFQIVLFRRVS